MVYTWIGYQPQIGDIVDAYFLNAAHTFIGRGTVISINTDGSVLVKHSSGTINAIPGMLVLVSTQPPITQPPITQPPITQPPITQPPINIVTIQIKTVGNGQIQSRWGSEQLLVRNIITVPLDTLIYLKAVPNTGETFQNFEIPNTGNVSNLEMYIKAIKDDIVIGYFSTITQPPITQPPITQPPITQPPQLCVPTSDQYRIPLLNICVRKIYVYITGGIIIGLILLKKK